MAVTPLSIRDNLQRSEWSKELPITSHQIQLSPITIRNDESDDETAKTRNQLKHKSSQVPPILTFILGILLGGVAVAVVLALWLAPSKVTITTTTTTTSTTSTTDSTTSTTSTTTSITTTSLTTTTTSVTTTSVTTTTTSNVIPAVNAFWSFDGNTNDINNIYNATPYNGPTFVTGYTGQSDTALAFDGNSSQYVTVPNSYVNLTYKSFTVEMWFKPTILTSADSGLFGQCATPAQDLCLIYMIRNYRLLLAFQGDDVAGITTLCINRWYHVAFVYDYSASIQYVYLDGVLEGSHSSNPYQGTSGDIFIGAINNGPRYYFTGYIDQVSLMTRTKTAAEILIDATLVCFFSFDSTLYYDSGPLSLSASGVSIASGIGRINNAISFTSVSSYFSVGGLTKLGTVGQAYSISIWIEPTSINGGTIIHVSKCNNSSCGGNWCLAFIGFTASGQIVIQSWSGLYGNSLVALTGPVLPINVWTHVVQTYSFSNGMRLFLNGTLFNQSTSFVYSASNMPDYIYLGSFPLSVCVANASNVISMGQYYGLLDEFRLFARDLTPTEIYQLANP